MSRDSYLLQDDRELLVQSEFDTYRSHGPGGQKRNKTYSAVRLRHRPTRIMVVAVESRSQHENRARALKRLRRAIALHIRERLDLETYRPSAVFSGCLTGASRLQVGMKDHRYNLVVAEVLDLLAACDCQVSTTAKNLGISTGNLVTFIRHDAKLLARVNQMRSTRTIKPLR